MTELNIQFYATGARFRMFRLLKAMEAAVRQYEIQPRESSLSWSKKVALFSAVAFFTFVFRWIIESFLHWEHQSIPRTLIMPVVLGLSLVFRPFSRWLPRRGGSLIIGDDFIEGRTQTNWFELKKRISRDRIKSILESKHGLCVMDRGEFAARMLGFVFVPATMPEYQEIRSELARWAPIKVRS
jgi:hypothetical protein